LGRSGIAFALLIPVSSVLIFRRRRLSGRRMDAVRLLGLMIAFVAVSGLIAGCGDDHKKVTPGTPPGTSTVTMTATAGSVTQTTTFGLTVQ